MLLLFVINAGFQRVCYIENLLVEELRRDVVQNSECSSFKDEIFELYQKNMSYSEIAKKLYINVDLVRKNISKALKNKEIDISEKYKLEDEIKDPITMLAFILNQCPWKINTSKVAAVFKVNRSKLDQEIKKIRGK